MQVTPTSECIYFNLTSKAVSWETSNNNDVGKYIIQIFGTLKSFKNSISFVLEIKMPQVISSPVL